MLYALPSVFLTSIRPPASRPLPPPLLLPPLLLPPVLLYQCGLYTPFAVLSMNILEVRVHPWPIKVSSKLLFLPPPGQRNDCRTLTLLTTYRLLLRTFNQTTQDISSVVLYIDINLHLPSLCSSLFPAS